MVMPPTAMMQKKQDMALRIFKGISFEKYPIRNTESKSILGFLPVHAEL
jgi:hypothetical protein